MPKLQIASKISFIFYCLYFFIFPFCYFRHDDWLILGTAVNHMPQDWSILWKANLYYNPYSDSLWFFRPVFKLLTYINFHLFGYTHFLWLTEQLVLLWATLYLAARALYWVRSKSSDVEFFLLYFALCVPLHFGSMVWVGEGLMNIPQVFFLSLALYGYLHPKSQTLALQLLSLSGFLGALLSKESSVAFPGLFFILALSQKKLKDDWKKLIAHAILALCYLYARFTFFEINPGYHPIFDYQHFFKPLIMFLGVCLLGPVILLISEFFHRSLSVFKLIRWDTTILFLGFFFVLMLPHLGHWFFSPGWFFLPGFWLIWSFPLFLKNSEDFLPRLTLSCVLIFVISTIPLVIQLRSVGWIYWGSVARKTHALIQQMDPEKTEKIYVEECENPMYPDSDLSRVAGSLDSLRHIWSLSHEKRVILNSLSCRADFLAEPGTKILRHQFPNIEVH